MTKIVHYSKDENFNIIGIFNNDNKLLCFGVADNNLEKVTNETFNTANDARTWGVLNYKGLVK